MANTTEKRNKTSYYDIDIDIKGVPSTWDLPEVFYLKDLKQRKIYIEGSICQDSVMDPIRHILQINREDDGVPVEKRKPILIYLTTNGGSVESGLQLIDVIVNSKTPIYTINTGYWYSMGFLIGIAGHKRYATRNARFLMHDGYNFVVDSSSKVKDQIAFQKKVDKRVRRYVLNRTKISEQEYDKKLRVEWYMFAEGAKEKGVIDYIIGEDCGIDEII